MSADPTQRQSSSGYLEGKLAASLSDSVPDPLSLTSDPQPLTPDTQYSTPNLIGREAELAQLQRWLDRALAGRRQIVFVTGEPGIGKTTLIDVFLGQLQARPEVRIAHGQCVEQYGAGEAYLPLLEAAHRLCRGPGGERMIEELKRYAPTWLAQLSGVIDRHELELLQQRAQGTSRERMLREMAEAAELFTARRGLVLVLEDLHWSDTATLEWLAYTARRREPAKLFVIGTYRPTDIFTSGHPLKGVEQELRAHGQGEELPLAPLGETAVRDYLATRFAGMVVSPALSSTFHRRSGGNPLFLTNIVDYLFEHGVIVADGGRLTLASDLHTIEHEVPESLRQLIEKQIERLDEDTQRALEVASVVGAEFPVALVAAGLQRSSESVEEVCGRLARKGQFIVAQGVEEWPDGTLSSRYGFTHTLYQNVLLGRIAAARRVRLHRLIAARKEGAYGDRVGEIAGELAVHFEAGRDMQRAVCCLEQATANAIRRHAYQEAINHLTKGLVLLETLSATPERAQQEVRLQTTLGATLLVTKGYAAPGVEHAYTRAWEGCQRIGETRLLFPTLWGLWALLTVRAEHRRAQELAEQLLSVAQRLQDSTLLPLVRYALGCSSFYMGDLVAARSHLQEAIACYDLRQHQPLAFLYGQDPGVTCLSFAAWYSWMLGYPGQALARMQEALTLARERAHPFSLGFALAFAAVLYQLRGETLLAQEHTEEETAVSAEHGFPLWLAGDIIMRGRAPVEQGRGEEGLFQMRQGLDAWQATGAEVFLTYFLALFADGYGKTGQAADGLAVLTEALDRAHRTGERFYEAELYRLKGELTLQRETGDWRLETGPSSPQTSSPKPQVPKAAEQEAEGYFLKALEVAQRQQAKSLELRAATSLARLWQGQGKVAEARTLLEDIYSWFTEGFDTKDLQEAEALLRALGSTGERGQSGRLPTFDFAADAAQPAPSKVERFRASGRIALASGETAAPPLELINTEHPTPHTQPPASGIFRREGGYWTLAFGGVVCRLKENRGMRYLALLLQHPNEELHALRIVTGDVLPDVAQLGTVSRGSVPDVVDTEGPPRAGFSDAGEILDPQARAAYTQRLAELETELAEAHARNDADRTDRLQEEIKFLTRELSHAVGLGGRVRRAASASERARINVTKAIKSAINKINKSHPALGHHLKQTIRTGTYCSYTPNPHSPVSWQT